MACSRERANPDAIVRVRLFASSGGYCQRPACNQPLFREAGARVVHIAEMAHIFAAQDDGPRANADLLEEDRGLFENLILLCPTCHTIIDKAPEEYPDAAIRDWKESHERRIADLFGVRTYPDRASTRAAVESLLDENGAIFKELSPDLDYRFNPEAEEADAWRHAMLARILPNNRRLLMVVDANRALLTEEERKVVEQFRIHVGGLINRHLGEGRRIAGPRFPVEFTRILSGSS